MHETKIQLSKEELEVVKNSAFILTKNRAIEKIVLGLGELSLWMEEQFLATGTFFSEEISRYPAKISRGEKYQGLPYLVLDYPRFFSKDDILAFRTFFWWGNHCSISLHARGYFLQRTIEGILQNENLFKRGDYYIASSGDEWVHDLQLPPHLPFANLDASRILRTEDFVRIGKLVPLDEWHLMQSSLASGFTDLLQIVRK